MAKTKRANDPLMYFGTLLGLDKAGMCALVKKALQGAEDGELYLERTQNESVSLDDKRVEAPFQSVEQGFGLRRVNGESVLYAYGNTISKDEILRAGNELREIDTQCNGYIASKNNLPTPLHYYDDVLPSLSLAKRVRVLRDIDRFARHDAEVTNVNATISGLLTQVLIVRADDTMVGDVRPMTVLSIGVQCTKDKKSEQSHNGIGGRHDYTSIIDEATWRIEVRRTIYEAKEKLRASPCPSGTMPVVLGSGWAGVLLHEAIGHGLEGDFVWKKTTVFADMLGKRVASELVNVIDDGTIGNARGSLSIDDEGTMGERTVLIENGILVGFMHDRQSARLLGLPTTGNARRESYEHRTQVRMRNTVMLSGSSEPNEIIANTPHGLYMPSFGGGQVDPITGQFEFKCELAYKIKDGQLTEPIVGATLIGNCTTVLLHVDMVGNDSVLGGAGTCGKGGQSVPVGIGQPTIRLSGGVTVGGTEANTTKGSNS